MGLLALTVFLFFVLLLPPGLGAETQIRFVAWRSDSPRVWDQAIKDFEARNPGTKVVREVGKSFFP